jgi:hypothetical protein
MPRRDVSPATLIPRLKALLRRYLELDDRTDSEQARPWPDAPGLKALKLKRLRLHDAIRSSRATLISTGHKPPLLS